MILFNTSFNLHILSPTSTGGIVSSFKLNDIIIRFNKNPKNIDNEANNKLIKVISIFTMKVNPNEISIGTYINIPFSD